MSSSGWLESKIVFGGADSSEGFYVGCIGWDTEGGLDIGVSCPEEWVCVELVLNCAGKRWSSLLVRVKSIRWQFL